MTTPLIKRLSGEKILLTGVTGFLAKAILEKILRAAPKVKRIYLLVRSRGPHKTAADRVEQEVLSSAAFSRLRAEHGTAFETFCRDRIVPLAGDLSAEHLGLDEQAYRRLARDLSLIINSAATVTFDEQLDLALALNTLGPSRLLQLARDAGDIPFVHVSTCYVSGVREGEITEEILPLGHTVKSWMAGDPPAFDLDAEITRMQDTCAQIRQDGITGSCDEELAAQSGELPSDPHRLDVLRRDWVKQKLIRLGMDRARQQGWNDTYTFSKCLGEQCLVRDRGRVPLSILRPSIIESSYEEPLPGWIDGLRMSDPLLIEYGKGHLPFLCGKYDVVLDIIPCDLVVNACLAAVPPAAAHDHCRIYQIASSTRNPLTIRGLIEGTAEAFRRRPMLDRKDRPITPKWLELLSPDAFRRRCDRLQAKAARWSRWLGKLGIARRTRLRAEAVRRGIDRLRYLAEIYSFYMNYYVSFRTDNAQALFASLHPEDRRLFPFDEARFSWREYLAERHLPGLRRYVLKGDRSPRGVVQGADILPVEDDTDEALLYVLEGANLFEAIERSARLREDKVALQMRREGEWLRYTYRQLPEAAARVQAELFRRGAQPGDRVVIHSESCPEWGIAYLGVVRGGMIAVPLDPQMPPEQVFELSTFTSARLILAGRTTVAGLEAARRARGKGKENDTPEIIALGPPFIPTPDALATSVNQLPPPAVVGSEDMASILFTSGTILAPKGVCLSHGNIISNIRSIVRRARPRRDDAFLSVLPMYHVLEFTTGFATPLMAGATVTFADQLKGPKIVALMKETGTTAMVCVPRLLQLFATGIRRNIAEASWLRRSLLGILRGVNALTFGRFARRLFGTIHRGFGGSLRALLTGGGALDPEVGRFLSGFGFRVVEGYGLTETSPVLTSNPLDDIRMGSVGPTLPDVELRVHNPDETGVGEIWARGPNVMSGYYRAPELTAEAFRDGWFRTGDLGYFDKRNYLWLTGRLKDLIVTAAGKNVYPDELERLYADLPRVKQLSVLGVNIAGHGEQVHAVIVPDYDGADGHSRVAVENAIEQALDERFRTLPSHQHILQVHYRDEDLPITSTLKVKRGQLRQDIEDGRHGVRASRALGQLDEDHVPRAYAAEFNINDASSPALDWLRQAIAHCVMVPPAPEQVRPMTHLHLDLSMDSIGRQELIALIESRYGIDVPDQAAQGWVRVRDVLSTIGERKPLAEPAAKRERKHFSSRPTARARHALYDGRSLLAYPIRWTIRSGLDLLTTSYLRVEGKGIENVPRVGPFILAPNHTSHLDTLAITRALRGKRAFKVAGAADYFFRNRLTSWLFGHVFDVIPFDRQAGGMDGLVSCIHTLQSRKARGNGLVFYPEGTRALDGRLQPFGVGVGVVAVETGAPVIPVWIAGAFALLPKGQGLPRPGKLRVTFGKPVWPGAVPDSGNRYAAYLETTRRIERAVKELGRTREQGED